jgi:hypothetical protein
MRIQVRQLVRGDLQGLEVPTALLVQRPLEVPTALLVQRPLACLDSLVLLEDRQVQRGPLDLLLHEPLQARLHRDHPAGLPRLEVPRVPLDRMHRENLGVPRALQLRAALEGQLRLAALLAREDLRVPGDRGVPLGLAWARNRPPQRTQARPYRKV